MSDSDEGSTSPSDTVASSVIEATVAKVPPSSIDSFNLRQQSPFGDLFVILTRPMAFFSAIGNSPSFSSSVVFRAILGFLIVQVNVGLFSSYQGGLPNLLGGLLMSPHVSFLDEMSAVMGVDFRAALFGMSVVGVFWSTLAQTVLLFSACYLSAAFTFSLLGFFKPSVERSDFFRILAIYFYASWFDIFVLLPTVGWGVGLALLILPALGLMWAYRLNFLQSLLLVSFYSVFSKFFLLLSAIWLGTAFLLAY